MFEKWEVEEIMRDLHLREEDAINYLENAIRDIAYLFFPSETEAPNQEDIPTQVASA